MPLPGMTCPTVIEAVGQPDDLLRAEILLAHACKQPHAVWREGLRRKRVQGRLQRARIFGPQRGRDRTGNSGGQHNGNILVFGLIEQALEGVAHGRPVAGRSPAIIEDDERVLIKAAAAWKEILNLNIRHCDYDDSSGDGIALFADKELELMGWHATEFDIEYRDMVTVIESACEGILLCIEQEEPYQFSGLGFIFDIMCARTRVREFCIESIQDKLQNDSLFSQENLSDDEREAAEFFGVLSPS